MVKHRPRHPTALNSIPRPTGTFGRGLPRTRVAFIDATWPNPDFTASKIAKRLQAFWQAMRKRKAGPAPGLKRHPDGTPIMEEIDAWTDRVIAPPSIIAKTVRRASRLEERHRQRSGVAHLPDKDLAKLEPARLGVDLFRILSEHRADEIAAAVHEEFPWMSEVTDALWHAMRQSVRRGDPGFRHMPYLLVGPPGIGKSSWARFVAKQIDLPCLAIDASGEGAGFGISGVQRGWGSAQPGQPMELILREGIGNPLIIIDEIDKTGATISTQGVAHSLTHALLPLLEISTARRWSCPYYRVSADMSWISWILTSNTESLIPAPLRSRGRIFRLHDLTAAELVRFAQREQSRRGLSDPAVDGIVRALESVGHSTTRPNLRTVTRLLELAERQDHRPVLH